MVTGVVCALWAAAAMTFGDWFWAAFIVRHLSIYGLIHGLLLFAWVGLLIGRWSGRTLHGIIGGAVVGLLGAASYYALAPLLGFSAMFVSWVGIWFGLAWLIAYLSSARVGGVRARTALLRGLIAATGSGLAFYALSDIWLNKPAVVDYSRNFATWTMAFMPGMLALFIGQRRPRV